MPQDTRTPPDPGVVHAPGASPNPARTRPEPPAALTPSDAAGERVRDEHPPEKPGPVTPAPPIEKGPDVNDVDRLEVTPGPFLGTPFGDTPER